MFVNFGEVLVIFFIFLLIVYVFPFTCHMLIHFFRSFFTIYFLNSKEIFVLFINFFKFQSIFVYLQIFLLIFQQHFTIDFANFCKFPLMFFYFVTHFSVIFSDLFSKFLANFRHFFQLLFNIYVEQPKSR